MIEWLLIILLVMKPPRPEPTLRERMRRVELAKERNVFPGMRVEGHPVFVHRWTRRDG